MRFYANFPEAINEIRRELKEMGIRVHTKSVQNLDITDNPDYDSFELQNYQYGVNNPDYRDIPLKVPEWAEAEYKERTCGIEMNPGEAWKLRESYWKQFLVPFYPGNAAVSKERVFDYAYPQRIARPLEDAIIALKKDLSTRRAFVPIFDRSQDDTSDFTRRLPCTLGYWFNYRQGRLNVTYLLRSSDFFEHFNYDIYLADRIKNYVAERVGVKPGNFTHWIGSLHCFAKNVSEVF